MDLATREGFGEGEGWGALESSIAGAFTEGWGVGGGGNLVLVCGYMETCDAAGNTAFVSTEWAVTGVIRPRINTISP